LLILSDLVLLDRDTWHERLLRWCAEIAGSLQLFLVPERSAPVSICAGGALGLMSIAAYALVHSRVKALAAASVHSTVLVATSDVGLAYFAPLEAGQWGELLALQIHPTRVYALKPNQKTRLLYNNYDYVVLSNSL